MIKVTNDAVDGGEKDEDGTIFTKKKDREKHGLGLKSIKATVEKYDGVIETAFENNKFSLSILLNI